LNLYSFFCSPARLLFVGAGGRGARSSFTAPPPPPPPPPPGQHEVLPA